MRLSKRSFRALALIALGLMFLSSFSPRSASADTVTSSDFREKSFSKVVDWFEYVRQYAAANGYPAPDPNEHAYLYTNFINVGGFQLFYVGLVNATHNGKYVTIPLQTFFEHYKTPAGKTAVTASSFISLVAFRDNSSSVYPNSPDRGDDLYASFSLGVNLTAFAGRPVPPYVATSQIIPLTSTDDNHWSWGLKYTNLNAIWWRIGVDPLTRYWDSNVPRGLARYAELTFTYDLTIDPATKTAKLTTSYTIGKMTDLWLLAQKPVRHLNSTGTYYLNQTRASTETIYDFLQTNQYKISIVLAQKSILVSQNTSQSTTERDDSGSSVNDTEDDVSRSAINTAAPDGERVFRAEFGVKPTYQLYDSSDSNPTNYNATTRTVRRAGWGGNPVFWFQNRFMGFLPLFVAHVDPALIQQARSGLVSFEVADYLYIISYQQWGGTRIVHDPDFTAFYQPSNNAGLVTALFIAVVAAAAVGGVFAFLFRRRKAANIAVAGYPGQAPPTQVLHPPVHHHPVARSVFVRPPPFLSSFSSPEQTLNFIFRSGPCRNMKDLGLAVEVSHLTKSYGPVLDLEQCFVDCGFGGGPRTAGSERVWKVYADQDPCGTVGVEFGGLPGLGAGLAVGSDADQEGCGYVPESPRLYEFLTATEYLDFIADVRGLSYQEKRERIRCLIEALDIEGKESDTVR